MGSRRSGAVEGKQENRRREAGEAREAGEGEQEKGAGEGKQGKREWPREGGWKGGWKILGAFFQPS